MILKPGRAIASAAVLLTLVCCTNNPYRSGETALDREADSWRRYVGTVEWILSTK